MKSIRRATIAALSLAAATVSGQASAAEMSFRLASHGGTSGETWIVADGEIVVGTPRQFLKFLQEEEIGKGARYEVYLNSPGGILVAGLEMGRIIRDYGFGTRVARSVPFSWSTPELPFEGDEDGHCFSACAFAFLGGKWRNARDRSLGVHQHYTKDALIDVHAKKFSAIDISAQQKVAALLADYIARMGVDGRFLTRAGTTGPEDIYLFSTAEMEEFSITWDDQAYTDWRIEPYQDGVIAVTDRHNMSESVALFCRHPGELRLLLLTRGQFSEETDPEGLLSHAVVDVFRTEIPRTASSARKTRAGLEFEFELPPNLDPKRGGGMSASGPTRFQFYQEIPSKRFNEMAKVVRRNCIGSSPRL